jgi:hypothetical protein
MDRPAPIGVRRSRIASDGFFLFDRAGPLEDGVEDKMTKRLRAR